MLTEDQKADRALGKDREGLLLSLPAESKELLMVFTSVCGKEFTRAIVISTLAASTSLMSQMIKNLPAMQETQV